MHVDWPLTIVLQGNTHAKATQHEVTDEIEKDGMHHPRPWQRRQVLVRSGPWVGSGHGRPVGLPPRSSHDQPQDAQVHQGSVWIQMKKSKSFAITNEEQIFAHLTCLDLITNGWQNACSKIMCALINVSIPSISPSRGKYFCAEGQYNSFPDLWAHN